MNRDTPGQTRLIYGCAPLLARVASRRRRGGGTRIPVFCHGFGGRTAVAADTDPATVAVGSDRRRLSIGASGAPEHSGSPNRRSLRTRHDGSARSACDTGLLRRLARTKKEHILVKEPRQAIVQRACRAVPDGLCGKDRPFPAVFHLGRAVPLGPGWCRSVVNEALASSAPDLPTWTGFARRRSPDRKSVVTAAAGQDARRHGR